MQVTIRINGTETTAEAEPRTLFVHHIRETLGLTGTHVGCDTSNCGACTVHLDGQAVKSCTVLAVQADGREVTTIEGLAEGAEMDRWHPVQQGLSRMPRPAVRVIAPRAWSWRLLPYWRRIRTPQRRRSAPTSRATSVAAPDIR